MCVPVALVRQFSGEGSVYHIAWSLFLFSAFLLGRKGGHMIIYYEFEEYSDVEKKYVKRKIGVDVPDEVGITINRSRDEERANDKRHKYHCPYSINNLKYEGSEYADDTVDFYIETESEVALRKKEADVRTERTREALSHLTETQQRRLKLYAEGKSLREISRIEKVDIKTVRESIEGAKKKFLKFFDFF